MSINGRRGLRVNNTYEVLDMTNLNVLTQRVGRNNKQFRVFEFFAENSAVDTVERKLAPTIPINTLEVTIPDPDVPVVFSFASTSANDTDGGTGMGKLIILGVGPEGHLQDELITLNGTTEVDSALTWIFVNKLLIFEAGTLNVNDGDIYVSDDADTWGGTTPGVPDTRIYNVMQAGTGINKSGVCKAHANQRLYFNSIHISSDATATKPVTIKLIKEVGPGSVCQTADKFIVSTGFTEADISTVEPIRAGDVFFITATAGGGGTVEVHLKISLIEQFITAQARLPPPPM
jgi:hypothetical protein